MYLDPSFRWELWLSEAPFAAFAAVACSICLICSIHTAGVACLLTRRASRPYYRRHMPCDRDDAPARHDQPPTLFGGEKVPPAEQSRPAPSPIIRAEANLLRFPLFALQTKNLKTLDGIECSGRMTRRGESYQFTYRATRNTARLYPGPLARRAHLAFLSLLHEHGKPVPHPLTWSWYDLCRRMQISYSGNMVRLLKDAITATTGLLIESDLAFYAKADQKLIRTEQQALHLYDRVVFVGTELPDGTKADQNLLWLSEWYRQNLDAFFTAPLDYALWKHLDAKSTIASRLYEFLLVNLFGPAPVLRINYETLVRFLPVQAEKYRSQAERQLRDAFQMLQAAQVLKGAEWVASKSGLAALLLSRGERLTHAAKKVPSLAFFNPEEQAENVEVKELRNVRPPEWQLLDLFYRDWTGEPPPAPSDKELTQARELLKRHGPHRAKAIVKHALKHMKLQFPNAKTFGAVSYYLADAIADVEREERRAQEDKQAKERFAEEAKVQTEQRREQEELETHWLPRWKALNDVEQAEIIRAVTKKFPHFVRFPELLEKRCVRELRDRKKAIAATESAAA
jgi:hypothetical protein